MNKLYEVWFSVGTSSDTSNMRTTISAFLQQQAKAMVEAQYGSSCHVFSVTQIN